MGIAAVVVALAIERSDPGAEALDWRSLPEVPEVVVTHCAGCHAAARPSELRKSDWLLTLERMRQIMRDSAAVSLSADDALHIWSYYRAGAPQELPALPPDPEGSPLPFRMQRATASGERPSMVASVRAVDLDRDERPEILVADAGAGEVFVLHGQGRTWTRRTIGAAPMPARAEPVDYDSDGDVDFAVAALGALGPTDKRVGSVVLFERDGDDYRPRTLLDDVGRVADVRAGDLDGDGDLDFAVAVFGHLAVGQVGWLEQHEPGRFRFHTLIERPGAIHVPLVDLDGDGRLDIVALISQASEEIHALLGREGGQFARRTLYRAPSPLFGSSGIDPVDLDGDGDLDLLYTNGDAFDVPGARDQTLLRPYHGVQWLENRGRLRFVRHDLLRYYGAYSAVAGDLDGDGDLDIVAASLFNDWEDPDRKSLIWLENDGRQRFTPHAVASAPTHLVTADVADLDGDGRLEIVAGGMHVFPPHDRLGHVTVWWNERDRGAQR